MRGSDTDLAKVERMIKLYSDGYGLKHIAKIELGRDTAKNTVRDILMRNGVEIRTSNLGRSMSRHPKAKGGKYSELRQEKLKKKRKRKCLSNRLELPLFEYGAEISSIEYRERYRNERDPEKLRQAQEKKNEEARAMGFKSDYQMKYQTDEQFRLKVICKRRFDKIVGGGNASRRMLKLLACSPEELKQWIESQWEDWMTWDNQGVAADGNWQIDHIVPCSWFDHTNEDHLSMCWNHQNLRPICAVENLSRGNRADDAISHLVGMRQTDEVTRLLHFAKSYIMQQKSEVTECQEVTAPSGNLTLPSGSISISL